MTEPRVLSIDDLDAFFSAHPAPKPAAKTKPKATFPASAPERYWIPDAVVMWESYAQCSCGCRTPATPQLFVRERSGRATRLLAIRSPQQYSELPRIMELAEDTQITCCPYCFEGQAEYTAQQMSFSFPEEVHVFKTAVSRAVNEVADHEKLLEVVSRFQSSGPAPVKKPSRESALPPSYSFSPQEIAFTTGAGTHRYISSVSSDEGPAFPHCYKDVSCH